MRTLLILPGNSIRNRVWGEAVAGHFGNRFDHVIMHAYEHWETGAENIDFTRETERVREAVATVPVGNELVVFAKSAGSLLTFIAIKAGALAPARCVFFGIPFDLAATGLFEHDWSPVETFKVPAIAFHNEHDPTVSHAVAVETIAAHCPHITLITTVGDNHGYFEFIEYDEQINIFFGQ